MTGDAERARLNDMSARVFSPDAARCVRQVTAARALRRR
jgi:hypothetical protein